MKGACDIQLNHYHHHSVSTIITVEALQEDYFVIDVKYTARWTRPMKDKM